jgi:phospholipid/cholesterol/gamma-HCH transport system substrate-binding protein
MKGNVLETLIGAVVIIIAALFLVFAYSQAGINTEGGYELSARFDRIGALKVGADVRISGIKVGTVVAERLDPKTFSAIVHFTVNPDIKLPVDTAAKISSEGLLGADYLSLDPGGSEQNLRAGERIRYTQGAIDLMNLISQAIFSATGRAQGGSKGSGAQPSSSPAPSLQPPSLTPAGPGAGTK